MAIDYAMLMASVANPGLLPLAINSDRSTIISASRTVRHEHKVKHSVKAGTGEELRGIAVDPARAVSAFQSGLDAIDRANVKFADAIRRSNEQRESKLEADRKRFEEMRKARERKSAEHDQAVARVNELEALRKSKFWGLSRAEDLELAQCKLKANEYVFDTGLYDFDRFFNFPNIEESIDTLRSGLEKMKAQAAVCIDVFYISPEHAETMHYLEEDPDAYIAKHNPFSYLSETV